MSRLRAGVVAAAAFLAGVVLVVAVRGVEHDKVRGRTVTETVAGPSSTITVARGDEVPDVTGKPLDVAKGRLADAGFDVEIASGGGLLGPIVDSDWVVTAQSPQAGEHADSGAAVALDIDRG